MTTATIDSKSKNMLILGSIALLALVIGVYWPVLCWLVSVWLEFSDYTYGFLVPIFSAYLLWDRRDMLKLDQLKGSYWGIPVILLSVGASVYCDYWFIPLVQAWTIVSMVGGLVLLVGGWHAVRWAWPSVAFLFFMAPLPQNIAGLLGEHLRAIGTTVSVFVLQTLGLPAIAEGNVIVLSNSELGVEDACSGLKMLMLFFAACVGAAFYLRNRDPLIRILVAISAPPIAIISNVARITITAFVYEQVSKELGDRIFHDLAGWLMMPIAMGLVWLETALLDRLFVVPEREAPVALGARFVGPMPTIEGRTRSPSAIPPGRGNE
ncbi:MAG TPA: exosortase/archaeosortase family protein [Thermoguttaceae bacterium]|nr:exosortase/archaeosortase family protein [Thermoguttaceae bacterium]